MIRRLPDHLVNKIAPGGVVEPPVALGSELRSIDLLHEWPWKPLT